MDISNLNVDQLKIVAFDLMEKIDVMNRDLTIVRNRITFLTQQNEQSLIKPQPETSRLNQVLSSEVKKDNKSHSKENKL